MPPTLHGALGARGKPCSDVGERGDWNPGSRCERVYAPMHLESCEKGCKFCWTRARALLWAPEHLVPIACGHLHVFGQVHHTQGSTRGQNRWWAPLCLDRKHRGNAWRMDEWTAGCFHQRCGSSTAKMGFSRPEHREGGIGIEVRRICQVLWCGLNFHIWPLPIKDAFSLYLVFFKDYQLDGRNFRKLHLLGDASVSTS